MGQSGTVEFGPWLRARISDAGYRSPSAFARAMGADPSLVLRWVNGDVTPTPDALAKAAQQLKIPFEDVLYRAFGSTGPPKGREIPPILVEFLHMLADDSPLDAVEQERIRVILDAVAAPLREKMRKARRDAGP